jgi:hypothetical protein
MKRAGCRAVFFGIESGSEMIQLSIRKNLNIGKVFEIADVCRKLGIEVHASFIIGFPEETKEDLVKTLQSIARLSIQGVSIQVSELAVLPGTPYFSVYKDQLKFDGLFSNFSTSFFPVDEIRLVLKHPEIFSSFYYLPVKSMDRSSLFLLENMLNLLHHFRNTLFFLRDALSHDLSTVNLLALFRKHIPELKEYMDKKIPLISFVVAQIENYLVNNKVYAENSCAYEVFAYETIKVHMLTRYARWKLLERFSEKKQPGHLANEKLNHFILTPFWQTLTTSHKLKSVLPGENGWRTEKMKIRKGIYHYLIIAISEQKCKVHRIYQAESDFLKKLSEKAVISGGILPFFQLSEYENNPLWEKMKKIGVIKLAG